MASLLEAGGSPPEYLRRLQRYLPTAASIVLVVVIAYILADLTWRLAPLPADEPGGAPVSAPGEIAENGERVDVDALIAANPFGEADPDDEPDAENGDLDLDAIDAPETQLNLKLRGVIATGSPTQARAIIATEDDGDKSYAIGDEIASGASLRAVYPDRVILERGGDLEMLQLPWVENGLEIAGVPAADDAGSEPSGNDADEDVEVPDELAELREEIQANPERITEVIRPAPYQEDGEMVGFRIFPGQMRDAFHQLGLRPGDIVTAVNGQSLDSPAAGMELMQELQDATSVELTIRRNDEQTTVNISLSR